MFYTSFVNPVLNPILEGKFQSQIRKPSFEVASNTNDFLWQHWSLTHITLTTELDQDSQSKPVRHTYLSQNTLNSETLTKTTYAMNRLLYLDR